MVKRMSFGSVAGKVVVLCNVFVFLTALHVVDISAVDEPDAEVESEPPLEAVLPHITFTNEMKVGMFFEKLRIDHSVIDPQEIARSLSPWEPYVQRYSKEYGVDPDLVRAIIYAESKGDPYRISKDGAIGLMQIMPSTANSLGFDNLLDPEENIKAGVMYIAWLVKNYGEEYVLWAWNAGPGKLSRNLMPYETQKFIVEVLSVKTFLKDDWNSTI